MTIINVSERPVVDATLYASIAAATAAALPLDIGLIL